MDGLDKAVALYIFSHKYFVPASGAGGQWALTDRYHPLGWSTAYYFDPDNDNGDVVWDIMEQMGIPRDLKMTNVWDLYLELMTNAFIVVGNERLNLDYEYRGPEDSRQLGFLTDDTIHQMEEKRKHIARMLMGLNDEDDEYPRRKVKPRRHYEND